MQVYQFSSKGLEEAFADSHFKNQIRNHFKKHGKIYITVTLLAWGFTLGVVDPVEAAGIDSGARVIYNKIIQVGKWIIIVKGGLDTISASMNGDFQSAKGNLMKYLMTYAVLWVLPYGMDQIDNLFKGL